MGTIFTSKGWWFRGLLYGDGGNSSGTGKEGWTFIFEKHSTRKIVDFSTIKHGKNGDLKTQQSDAICESKTEKSTNSDGNHSWWGDHLSTV